MKENKKLFSVRFNLFLGLKGVSHHFDYDKAIYVAAPDMKTVKFLAPKLIKKKIKEEFCKGGEEITYFSLGGDLDIEEITKVNGKNDISHKVSLVPKTK